ncbi:hypothetical protein PRIC1_007258 [Phytophthora ramorum]|uniref:Uncharacterized protein n=1 Tax=Phytophthora ramorum TaxID=164328 RepID=H3GQZ7_PHYRM
MADPAADTTSTESGAATVSKQISTMVLQDDDDVETNVVATRERQDSVSSVNKQSTPPSDTYANDRDKVAPPHRRPLFSSMREALESSGQVKEEPGGYVIKRRSNSSSHQHQQQLRSGESAGRSKNRHAKQCASKAGGDVPATAEDEADAAGYTVIRRRSSCDETLESSSALASSAAPSHSVRRNPRASTQVRGKKQQRPRRGSMSAMQLSSSSLLASTASPPPSVPPGFQPRAASRVLRPPPGLTSAASGWVVKAAAPAVNANKIAEPPVEALWPEMKATAKTDSGWATATTENLQAQAWPASASSNASAVADDQKVEDDDDLLARLGVTL